MNHAELESFKRKYILDKGAHLIPSIHMFPRSHVKEVVEK